MTADQPVPLISTGELPSAETITAISARPAVKKEAPVIMVVRSPTRLAMVGATADSGIITAAIGRRPAAAPSAE